MECLNCKTTNEPDSRYCRRCGISIKKCPACALALEPDALYCRRCGKLFHHPPESRAAAVPERPEHGAANAPDFDDEVDFTTKITPKRVQPSPGTAAPRRLMRVALYAVVVLLPVVAAAAVVAMWLSPGGPSAISAHQVEELRADLEEYKRMVAETKDADRRAILQEIGVILSKMRADERKATRDEIRKAIADAREDERKAIGDEIAKAVAKAREKDRGVIIAELTKLKAKTRNREFANHIERTIALFRTNQKAVTDTRRGHDG